VPYQSIGRIENKMQVDYDISMVQGSTKYKYPNQPFKTNIPFKISKTMLETQWFEPSEGLFGLMHPN
jgi:hypothetical protein